MKSDDDEADDEDSAEEDKGKNWGTARVEDRDERTRIDAGEGRTTAIGLQRNQTRLDFKYNPREKYSLDVFM